MTPSQHSPQVAQTQMKTRRGRTQVERIWKEENERRLQERRESGAADSDARVGGEGHGEPKENSEGLGKRELQAIVQETTCLYPKIEATGHEKQSSRLHALMHRVCHNPSLHCHIGSLEAPQTQQIVDVLFLVMEDLDPRLDPDSATRFHKALLCASKSKTLYPERLRLDKQLKKNNIPYSHGSFGEVFRGSAGETAVAIKMLKVYENTDLAELKKAACSEAIPWCLLDHANILPLYGVYEPRDPDLSYRIGFVSPWMENGNIVKYLRDHPGADRILLISDTISGISYIHDRHIVHGDIKGANILVTSSGRACLADLGCSLLSDTSSIRLPSGRASNMRGMGTTPWRAPELHDRDTNEVKATFSSDIYSFGCVSYEIMTGKAPFHEMPTEFRLISQVLAGGRPTKPCLANPVFQGRGEAIWSLTEAAWNQDPAQRPTAREIQQSPIFASIVDQRAWGDRNPSAVEFRRWASTHS